ncbi:MAG: PEGA domain-containing protein [Candidatus Saccharibacteria bacterium]
MIKIIAIYAGMTSLTVATALFIIMLVLGFRLDTDSGQIEQLSLLQFNSSPIGATVAVDGKVVSGQTPNKTSATEGNHEIVVWREGYETWRKTVYVKPGSMTWLNYILLVPQKMTSESVANYDTLAASLASPGGKYMMIHKKADAPVFDLVDLSGDTVKTTELTMPKKTYSEAYNNNAKHSFVVDKWDPGERYVLVKHIYSDKFEWLVMDTQNADTTKNITKLFNLTFDNLLFSGNGGNVLFVLESGNIRKVDTNAETISKLLVSNVVQFSLYGSNIITYIGAADMVGRVVGLYRDGDTAPYIIKTITGDATVPLRVAAGYYFKEDYVAISSGKQVEILKGNYQNAIISDASGLKHFAIFDAASDISDLSFSHGGQYILAQSGTSFSSYDLEYQKPTTSTIDAVGSAAHLSWLNGSYLWSDNGGNLNTREFDNANSRIINPVVVGQDATVTVNGRYIYSIGKSESGYQLQRVRIILP